jgi:hypothetical protein
VLHLLAPLLLLSRLASAVDVQLGGGLDVMSATSLEGAGTGLQLRQLEGDLQLGSETVTARLDLDIAATIWDGSALLPVYALGPEQLTVRWQPSDFYAQGGIAPGPWRLDHVDPWDNALVSTTLLNRLVPGSVLGAEAGFDNGPVVVRAVGGADAPFFDFLHLGNLGPTVFRPIVGAHALADVGVVEIGGGGWWRPLDASLAAQLGLRANIGIVGAFGEIVGGTGNVVGGQVGASIWPEGLVSPSARVELVHGVGPGIAVGVTSTLVKVLKLKAEASYEAGYAAAYLEASLASPWPPGRAGRKKKVEGGKVDT